MGVKEAICTFNHRPRAASLIMRCGPSARVLGRHPVQTGASAGAPGPPRVLSPPPPRVWQCTQATALVAVSGVHPLKQKEGLCYSCYL